METKSPARQKIQNLPTRHRKWNARLAGLKAALVMILIAALTVGTVPFPIRMTAWASEVEITSDKIPHGKTGKKMNLSFRIKNTGDASMRDLAIGFDVSGGEIWDEEEGDREYGYSFPFEVTEALPTTENPKSIGRLGDEKTVSLSGVVRRDLTNGYYKAPVVVMDKDGSWLGQADLTIWITQSTGSSDDEEDETKTYDFVLGEGQSTPDGVYPHVLDFALNLRNNSPATVYNVKATMVMDADSEKFPFEINDANYDRMFEKIEVDETVPLTYSFAIREDVYSGYYPITMKIYYSKSSTGDELQTYETLFYVRIHNKDKEDEYGEFNEHDRERARLVVDGFTTEPATIIAGQDFELILRMKNASSSISATNILYSLESEKVSDSAVFTTESGSSSVAMDSLRPGEVKEIRVHLLSKAGVDQRSYGMTIKAKYDSPEFKNAEESMVVDIPVKQIPRLNTGTFEVMPDSINVGGESNVMFAINNTGKVILYNVMVKFEADSIQTVDTYVGNIKPGETGNVDCMVTGAAQTLDDGKIRVTITYEDENGAVSSEEKELTLFVMEEDLSGMEEIDMGNFEDMPMEEAGFFQKYQDQMLPAALAVIVVLLVLVAVLFVKHRKLKASQEEDEDDEIS